MRMAGTVLPALIAATILVFAAPAVVAGDGDAAPAQGNMQVASTGGGLAALFGGGRNLSGFRQHVNAGAIVVRKSTPTECLPGNLKGVLSQVAEEFGAVSVQSTHRSPQRNRRAGGGHRNRCISIVGPSIFASMRAGAKSWPGCVSIPISGG